MLVTEAEISQNMKKITSQWNEQSMNPVSGLYHLIIAACLLELKLQSHQTSHLSLGNLSLTEELGNISVLCIV